ncbi:MAG: tetratricopeptide repeat protein [Duncaniella sp.]|nr:tetratricopeptide repeat protein [Duncaniella sp.]MDE5751429.1 tetratricopeptide repeat protein [Duncaniella sp.]MDE5918583.1 tetratricopeptide repeat protein [Duncaniella sp.]MDE6169698.1 tetratricopeptide repeat protein [Duncaniella sp.]MDE6327182.1 tetratricopeptide repeat protein [Duncaniella sp.]
MAENKLPQDETRTSVEEVNDTLTGLGEKVQNNPRFIVIGSIVIAVVIALILIWVYAIRQPGINAANEALGQADMELLMGNDSVALAKYQQVAADHGYKAGDLANLNAAILLYKDKKYEEALAHLKDYSASESIIGAGAKSLEGDCYVNLKKYDEALSCYKEAVKISDENPAYTPAFLLKEATVLREMKKYKEEAAVYEEIINDYPNYGAEIGTDLKKYLERARAAE